MTWEEQQKADNELILNTGIAIARAMGIGWQCEKNIHDVPYLIGPDGAKLWFGFDAYNKKDKLRISGTYPSNARGEMYQLPYGVANPVIGVSIDRGGETIAKAIKTRLLPEYLPLLQKAIERNASHDAWKDKQAARTKELAAAFGVTDKLKPEHVNDGKFYSYSSITHGYSIEGRVGGSIDLKIENISMETAKKIAEIIMAIPPKDTDKE